CPRALRPVRLPSLPHPPRRRLAAQVAQASAVVLLIVHLVLARAAQAVRRSARLEADRRYHSAPAAMGPSMGQHPGSGVAQAPAGLLPVRPTAAAAANS